MKIPEFHQFFFSFVDIGKFVDHHARFNAQPFRIRLALAVHIQLFGLDRQASVGMVIKPETINIIIK